MQLAPASPLALSTPIVAPAAAGMWAPIAAPAARPLAPAAPGTSAPLEGAVDGAARLALPPIYDFPGMATGDAFDIVKGSKVGPLGVKGEAQVLELGPNAARFHVKAGRFGIKVDVNVDIVQLDEKTVRISATGSGIPAMSEVGRVLETRTNYAVFEQVSDPSKRTVISHDGAGHVTIDTVVPTFGDAHLELEKRA
jgi:hypothetical protein